MNYKKSIILLLVVIGLPLLGIALFWATLSPYDKEWFTGHEWKARTAQIEQWLGSLSQGWTHEIFRYEGSDFVKIHGPNGEFINFGSLTPEDLLDSEKINISQIGNIPRQCNIKVHEDDKVSLAESFIFDSDKVTANDIARNYEELFLIWKKRLSICKY